MADSGLNIAVLQISIITMPSVVGNLCTSATVDGMFGKGDILYASECFVRLCTYCV